MKRILAAFALTMLSSVLLFGQTTTGRLSGTVSGPDGKLVPGATVLLTDSATGKQRTVITSGEGEFQIPLLDFGKYTVKITAKGFKTQTTSITMEVNQEYSLPVVLSVGDVSEVVNVTAGTDVVNSTNAELSSTLSNRQVTELPNATKNPLSLILTQAGSASNPSQNTSINGGRTSSTNVTRDGVNIQDNFIRSNATDFSPGRPSTDNVEEFTLTAQSSVDTGFGSAQITFVTPRGGNQFHGAAWEYNRNSAFGANSWFSNAGGNWQATDANVIAGLKKIGDPKQPRPFRNRNQFGGKVGGPILKNKLFFWAYGEKLIDEVNVNKLTTVLTPAAKAGIFQYPGSATGANIFTPGVLVVGLSGTPVPTGINAASAAMFLAGMPSGNSFETGDGINTTGYRFFQRGDQRRDGLTTRIDYDLNSQNNINGVYDYEYEKNLRSDLGGTTTVPLVTQPAKAVLYSGGWRYSPTSNISNEFRIGSIFSTPDFIRTDPPATEYILPALITTPGPLNGASPFYFQGRRVTTFNMQDTVTWQIGNHSLRFGAQYQSVFIKAYNDAGIQPFYSIGLSAAGPTINFTNLATAGGGVAIPAAFQATARSLAALLGGIIASGQQTFNTSSQTSGYVAGYTQLRPFRFSSFAPYILDQWKVRSDLTLNFGLRYDYYTALKLDNGLLWEPTVAAGRSAKDAVLDPAGTFQFIGGNSGVANTFYKPDKNNFAPSIGVAWAPRDIKNGFFKTLLGEGFVLRGGFRMSYVNDELVTAPNNALANQPGFATTVAALNTITGILTSSLDDRLGVAHVSTTNPGTFLSVRNYITNNTAAFSNTGTAFAVDPKLQTPTQHDYQVGVQRQFGDWVAEARYVGGYSSDMLRTIDYNQVIIPAAYRADFNIVRANVLAGCTTNALCAAGTTMISTMVNSGGITATNTFGTLVNQGQIAELIWQQLIAGNIPNTNVAPVPAGNLRAQFLPNPNVGVANVLLNGGKYNYNSGQFELRRRFKQGLYLQANYTFSKELTDAIGTGQTRVEPYLDNANPGLDYTRADYDQTHVFNVNAIYELPFGKGRHWLNGNRWLDYAIGGWQLGLVWRVGSGAPITFTDARGTLNRSGRAGRQTAMTNLTDKQLRALLGVFRTPCGIYFVNPTAININQANLQAGNCTALNTGVTTGTVGGAAASGFGSVAFPGQIFFNNGSGQTGNLRRAVANGPWLSSADVSLLKNFRITERIGFQIRAEAFNFTNTPYFAPGQFIDINSTSFGRITGVSVAARVIQFAGRLSF